MVWIILTTTIDDNDYDDWSDMLCYDFCSLSIFLFLFVLIVFISEFK